METTLVGTLEGLSSLRASGRTILMTTISETSALDPASRPVPGVREFEGSLATVKGTLSNDVLFETQIIEIFSSIITDVAAGMIEDGILTEAELLERTKASIERLTGGPPPPPAPALTHTCALVVGHRPGAKGTSNRSGTIKEYDFNDALAPEIKARVRKATMIIVHRDDNPNGYNRLPAKINALNPDFIVSLHCNGFDNQQARGTEMLYFHTSKNGRKMALVMQRNVLDALELSNRRTKSRTGNDRGGHLLKNTHAPCVIAEPFFMTNDNDMQTALDRRDGLIDAYAASIDEITEELFT